MAQGQYLQFVDADDHLIQRPYEHCLEGDFLLLSNEGCARCGTCTWPDAPCRFPEELSPSVEGFGIMVYELAKSAGLVYRSSSESVRYFGMCCFR